MKAKRLDPTKRKEDILAVAVKCAESIGVANLRRDDIADHAGVARGLVSRYFNTMPQLRRAVMRYAVHTENLSIIAQGIAMRDPEALKVSPELRDRAIGTLSPSAVI
jgi:AcrR family transcriptional regulator